MIPNARIFDQTKPNGNFTESFSNGKEHCEIESIPRASTLARLSEKTEVSKSTLWLIGVVPSFVTVVLLVGGSWALSIREDQTQKESLKFIQYQLVQKADQDKLDQAAQIKRDDEAKAQMQKIIDGYQEMREFKIKVEAAKLIK